MTADDVIRMLGLEPHPREGGFFREIYRSPWTLQRSALPGDYPAERSLSTAIYYLLTPETCSRMHRLRSDEVFHFYRGDPVEMLQLEEKGQGRTVILGAYLESGQQPQVVVRAGIWQGARLKPGGKFALLGTTVAPGFDYTDYEDGQRDMLQASHPAFVELIERLTPG